MSESTLSEKAKISRLTLRQVERGEGNPTLHTLNQIAHELNRKLELLLLPENDKDCLSSYSTVAVSMKVVQDGFISWQIHFMELVDEYRATLDPRLFLLPPVSPLDFKLKALLASITVFLCDESGFLPPSWASRSYFLPTPWFVSEMDSLKAMAVLESALPFRRNNIFVHDNFLKRA